mgnify:CR=1 FL=1|jgi:hypothetical protein
MTLKHYQLSCFPKVEQKITSSSHEEIYEMAYKGDKKGSELFS